MPNSAKGEEIMSRLPQAISQEHTVDGTPQSTTPIDGVEFVPGGSVGNDEPIASLRVVRAQVEIKVILAALKRTGWNRKQAARLLHISYRGLLYKIRRHNITAA
jgi:DNA-binding NtrC family response regulator